MTLQLSPPLLKIGQLSVGSGVPIKTIRYYEERGLLKVEDRTDGQYRLFQPQTVNRLIFIKRLQSFGLTLQEIAECLAVYDHGDLPCDDIHHKLVHQVEKIDHQVAELLALRQELAQILERWQPDQTESAATICPNLPI